MEPRSNNKNACIQKILQLKQSSQYPFNCVGVITTSQQCVAGVLISGYTVLSVAHPFVKIKQEQSEPVMIQPQQFCLQIDSAGKDFKKKIAVSEFRFPKQYLTILKRLQKIDPNSQQYQQLWKESQKYNYALLKLEREVKLFYYPVLTSNFQKDNEKQAQSILICGYVSKKQQYCQVSYKTQFQQRKQIGLYEIGSKEGQSGSPVFFVKQNNTTYLLVGIHQGYDKNLNKNICTLFTDAVISKLRMWQNEMNITFIIFQKMLKGSENKHPQQKKNHKQVVQRDEISSRRGKMISTQNISSLHLKIQQQEKQINLLNKQFSKIKQSRKYVRRTFGTVEDCQTDGLMLGKANRYTEAIQNYRKVLQYQPENPRAHCNLGVVLHKNHNIEEAIKHYKIAIKIDPNYYIAYDNLGNAYADEKNWDEATKNHRKSIQINPHYPHAYFHLGSILDRMGNYKESIRCYWKLLELTPKNSEAYNSLGVALHSIGKLDVAIGCYRKAIQADPEQQYSFGNIEWALSEARDEGRVKKQIQFMEKIVKQRPGHDRAQETLMRLKAMMSRIKS